MISKTPTNIDEYIVGFTPDIQLILNQVRSTIRHAAPDAEELIGYGMPAYKTHGRPLVYFAAFKNHIGFYATPTGHAEFAKELSTYKQGKGSVQFPIDQPLPLELIFQIVEFRVIENQKAKAKKK
ncbi:hypothetical protein AQPE_3400 [Aquipluma nitroreducens]|uniref:YdhG-like domain-containing protein n=1 Tax=Aquipluma nitroreducens TaxID=2010828 RepID=A0A5K7SD89_9BACT|nr:DUF1801 domain-containing protein [Aquipluma nitroreducens]BBE19224.1 hypothetical protein AQPE_3400 [Aquipluma nitroreducens]